MKKSAKKAISTANIDKSQSKTGVSSLSSTKKSETTASSVNKVYYIADTNGTIASYNPNYILRQVPGQKPYKIYLPSESGTLILEETVASITHDIYLDINQLNEDVDTISSDYTALKDKVDDISEKVDGYLSKKDLKEVLEEAIASDIPETNYTVDDIVQSYNKLLQSLRNLVKE